MTNQEYFVNKYKIDITQPNPVLVAKVGRKELVELWKELDFRTGAEIGVQRGDFAKSMCQTIPGLKYFGIDSWTAYEGYGDILASRHGQEAFDQLYKTTVEKLAPFDATLIRKWSTDAAKNIAPESLDFVYIDANHEFEFLTADIAAWLPKIKKGGIIAGHDYARINGGHLKLHCKDVVDGWTNAHEIKPLFVCLGDNSPNWMWFKQ